MLPRQLQLVVEFERQKEDKLALQYAEAQQDLQAKNEKLVGLDKHKHDYINNMNNNGQGGISPDHLMRFQAFISQLDKACTQQRAKIQNANKVVEQRRALWLQQQRKRKSIELLLEKQERAALAKQDKQEQLVLDEFAQNQFVRRS
ncbi:flagellar export protein FliJ [Catenovulum adriaticum]|uniref:Flagellar FliJ protein n=1 Tax=Catenovulum adriaticum TaxID=2984846 RepID=A0ABY7AKY4_9ALTE|nr:flagellar export protein FliJ [Catenovulum sp. TS8]WAJ69316.1 flagellar export protein FliJ [Catenovulum sp. TS8]